MANLIVSAGTISNPTAGGSEVKHFYDGTRWWVFYMKSGTANTLFYSYSTDLSAWTEASIALAAVGTTDGLSVDVDWDAGSNVALVTYEANADPYQRYMRGNLSGTTITWTATTRFRSHLGPPSGHATALTFSTAGVPASSLQDTGGNIQGAIATNAITTGFADDSWTQTGPTALNDVATRVWIGYVSTGSYVTIVDDLSGTPMIQYSVTNAGTWSGWTTIYSGANVSRSTWSATQISATGIYLVGISATNTLTFRSFNGISWTTLTAPSYPAGGIKADGICLVQNGTDIWAIVIQSDGNNTVSWNKYTVSGGTWSGWTDIVTSAQTRNFISPGLAAGNSLITFLWTQTNGANFDIYVESLSSAGGGAATIIYQGQLYPIRYSKLPADRTGHLYP
jgi:hypothetical protein